MNKVFNNLILFVVVFLVIAGTSVRTANNSTPFVSQHIWLADKYFANFYGEFNMYKNKDPSEYKFLFGDAHSHFKSLEPDEDFLTIEEELRQRNLLYDPDIQWLVEKAASSNDKNRRWARAKLKLILESERILDKRSGNPFRPLAPPQLLSQGNLHLYNQVDGTAWLVPIDALTRGMLVTGPQGGGKTRLLIWICKQLSSIDPPIPFLILDPKLGLKDWADYLDAAYIDISDISIDLSPPPGLTYQQWLPSLMPQLGEIIGVIYGVELLQELATSCIELREKYIAETGITTEISLFDLYQGTPFISEASSGRRYGYREAITTGLSRIITGSGDLFRCRKGVDLSTLLNRRVIIGCRSLTDDFAVKFLAFYLLYYLYECERFCPPTDQIKRVLALDDATRFLAVRAGFDAASTTSSFTHIFSVLRSSGNGVIFASQVPHLVDPGILALSHTVLCVGALHHADDTKLIAQMMNLNDQQRSAVTALGCREAIGICAGSAWPKVVYGFTVDVPDLRRKNNG